MTFQEAITAVRNNPACYRLGEAELIIDSLLKIIEDQNRGLDLIAQNQESEWCHVQAQIAINSTLEKLKAIK